ncbi:MAG: hypothetical protein H7274_09200 [Rhodoferax sp.]|nr:hypothetical protein [Rhodoferax sp.]
MHKAPTVDYPVGPSRFQARALLVLWWCVAGVHVLWWLRSDRLDWRHGLSAAVTVAAALLALRAWQAASIGRLHWDGQTWWWETGGTRVSGQLKPRLDLQSVLLLEFSAPSCSRQWLWLERQAAPSRWSALRRAVHAPTRVDLGTPDGGLPPAEQPGHGQVAR